MAIMDQYVAILDALRFNKMYKNDFFLTWEKTQDEIEAVFTVAEALKALSVNNISTRIFDSGLGFFRAGFSAGFSTGCSAVCSGFGAG